jgi:hypothetical protein
MSPKSAKHSNRGGSTSARSSARHLILNDFKGDLAYYVEFVTPLVVDTQKPWPPTALRLKRLKRLEDLCRRVRTALNDLEDADEVFGDALEKKIKETASEVKTFPKLPDRGKGPKETARQKERAVRSAVKLLLLSGAGVPTQEATNRLATDLVERATGNRPKKGCANQVRAFFRKIEKEGYPGDKERRRLSGGERQAAIEWLEEKLHIDFLRDALISA